MCGGCGDAEKTWTKNIKPPSKRKDNIVAEEIPAISLVACDHILFSDIPFPFIAQLRGTTQK